MRSRESPRSDLAAHVGALNRRVMKVMKKLVCLLISFRLFATYNPLFAASENGRAGAMPAYYDGDLFTINFKEEPTGAEEALLAHNGSINVIYMSDNGLPGGEPFISVLDAIQGDGFNPLWVE